jgi:RHS repeat-associated protein
VRKGRINSLYDYRHRFYHPGLGRFLQTDPSGFGAGDMNLFRYCDDDPVDRSDPTGEDAEINQVGDNYTFTLGIRYYPTNSAVKWDNGQAAAFNKAIQDNVRGNFTLADGRTVNVMTKVIESTMNMVGMSEGHGWSKTSGNRGFWMTEGLVGGTREFTALHEALHLLGVKDHYKRIDGKVVPDEGYENDVMGGLRGGVSAADIAEVIKSNGKGASGNILRGLSRQYTSGYYGANGPGNLIGAALDTWTQNMLCIPGGGPQEGEGFHPSGPN